MDHEVMLAEGVRSLLLTGQQLWLKNVMRLMFSGKFLLRAICAMIRTISPFDVCYGYTAKDVRASRSTRIEMMDVVRFRLDYTCSAIYMTPIVSSSKPWVSNVPRRNKTASSFTL